MPVNDNVNDICTIQTCLNMVLPILDLAKFQPKSSDDNAAYLHSSTVTQRGRWGLWRLWCRCFLAAGLMLPGRQSPWSLGIDQHIYCLGHDHQRLDPVLYSIWWIFNWYGLCKLHHYHQFHISKPVLCSKWYGEQRYDKANQLHPILSQIAWTVGTACTWSWWWGRWKGWQWRLWAW